MNKFNELEACIEYTHCILRPSSSEFWDKSAVDHCVVEGAVTSNQSPLSQLILNWVLVLQVYWTKQPSFFFSRAKRENFKKLVMSRQSSRHHKMPPLLFFIFSFFWLTSYHFFCCLLVISMCPTQQDEDFVAFPSNSLFGQIIVKFSNYEVIFVVKEKYGAHNNGTHKKKICTQIDSKEACWLSLLSLYIYPHLIILEKSTKRKM